MRILLVSPRNLLSHKTSKWLRIPQLVLPLLKALTPPEHEVFTVDEECEDLPPNEHWDVAGISAMTATAPRAYDLAAQFRRAGTKVVLGGIHPSVMPEEAARYADAVVVGEAESAWPQVLDDIRHNRLQRVYHNPQPDLAGSPLPLRGRCRSPIGFPPYIMPIMAARGCPFDCEFCCVHRVYGSGQRHLPVARIVEDIRKHGAKLVLFLDDNIGGHRAYAMELFAAIRPLKIRWCGQGTVRFILDEDLFRAAVRSGLGALFVGVENVEEGARKTLRKLPGSIDQYEQAIARSRAAGVMFHASLIFGLDEQSPQVFDRTLDFLMRNQVPSATTNVLTPYPGTHLFDRLLREGRLLHTNWTYYDHTTVCYQPLHMSPEELAERYIDFRKRLYSWSSMWARSSAHWRSHPLMFWGMNIAFHRATKRQEGRFAKYFTWLRSQKRPAPVDGKPGLPPLLSTDAATATAK